MNRTGATSQEVFRRRLSSACFIGAALLASSAQAQTLRVVETPGANARATLEIDGKTIDIDAALMRPPVSTGALLIDLTRDDDLRATALRRGLSVATLDLTRLPEPARAAALRALIPQLARRVGATRVLARAQGEAAAPLIAVAAVVDGLLLVDAPPAPEMKTRVIESWGSDAYWRAIPRQSVESRPPGKEPANRRSFFVAGATAARSGGNCAGPANPRGLAPALRALLVALDDWTKGVAPPASRAPGVEDLVPVSALAWPKAPGFPPAPRQAPARLVPKIDADGNERAGLRLPDHQLALASFTGFNAQNDPAGAPCPGAAALPFATARAEREKSGDPRLSLVERYGSRAYFVATMRVVADKLVKERLLLQEDADACVAAAKTAPF